MKIDNARFVAFPWIHYSFYCLSYFSASEVYNNILRFSNGKTHCWKFYLIRVLVIGESLGSIHSFTLSDNFSSVSRNQAGHL